MNQPFNSAAALTDAPREAKSAASPVRESGRSARLFLTAAAALADQGFYAGAHFLLNVLLARWMTKAEYGGFSIAFTMYAFLISLQSAVIIEPVYILSATVFAAVQRAYLRDVLYLEVAFSLLVAAGLAIAAALVRERLVAGPLYALSVGSVFMLLFSLLRAECYVGRAPAAAARLSGVYFAANLSLLLALHAQGWLTASTAMLALSASSALIVILGRVLRSGRPTAACGEKPKLPEVIREHYSLGKWFVPSSVLSLGINFFPIWLTAYFLGLESAGGFRALVTLVLPIGHGLTAASNVLLPRLSRQWTADRQAFERTVRQGAWAISLVCALFFFVCGLFRNEVEGTLYGGRYRNLSGVIPVIALLPAAQAVGVLYSAALRAMRCPRDQLVSTGAQSVLGAAAALALIPRFGVYGTTLTCLFTFSVGAVFTSATYHWRLRSFTGTATQPAQGDSRQGNYD